MLYCFDSFVSGTIATIGKYTNNEKLYGFSNLDRDAQSLMLLETFMRRWGKFMNERLARDASQSIAQAKSNEELIRKGEQPASRKKMPLFKSDISPSKKVFTLNEAGNYIVPFKVNTFGSPRDTTYENVQVFCEFSFQGYRSFGCDVNVISDSPELEEQCRKIMEKKMEVVRTAFQLHYQLKTFLEDFFDTLHLHNLSLAKGEEVIWMCKIYKRALKYYPDFKSKSLRDQILLIQKGYLKGRTEAMSRKELATFAKSTFEVFVDANIINTVIMQDFLTREEVLYHKIAVHRKPLATPAKRTQPADKSHVAFIEYTDGHFRTSFLSFDLWYILCSNSTTLMVE